MNLYSSFVKSFKGNRKLIFDNSTYTYEDFRLKIELATKYLDRIRNKNKILVLTDNPYHLGIFIMMAARIGKIIIPLNKDLREKQILNQISISDPNVIIYSPIYKKIICLSIRIRK